MRIAETAFAMMIPLLNLCALDAALGRIQEQTVEYFSQNTQNRELLASQQPDGSWRDIDYKSQRLGEWPPLTHLIRVQQIAAGYRHVGSLLYNRPEARDAVLRGLEFWVRRDPTSSNWWYQSIGAPQSLCITILLLRDELPPELLRKLTPILDRSRLGMTAQNRVWLAGIHLFKGVIYGKSKWAKEGAESIAGELRLAPNGAEGIQPDWSFHQHGAQLQFGSYGLVFFTEMIRWATVLQGTPLAFPEEKMKILQNYFDYGLRWVLFNRQVDFSACGRQIAPGAQQGKYRSAVAFANRLAKISPGWREKVGDDDFHFSGSRFFPDSDFFVQRTPDCYWSVKMTSSRTVPSETIGSENQLGRLTGHGATLFMSENNELHDIGGVWDWRKIPGVTAVQNDSSLRCNGPALRNQKDWVGGLSDEAVGFCAMDYDNGEVAAQKSYFFFGGEMAAVGSRIRSKLDAPVLTTVAQFRSAGETVQNEAGNEFRNGNFSYRLFHADRGARAETAAHTGNWKRVTATLSEAPVQAKLFTLTIDHGVRPQNGSYAYLVAFRSKPEESDVRLLKASSDAIHAVAKGGTIMAAFFEPGSVTLPDRTILEAKQPALVMLRNSRIYAADPGRKRKQLEFSLGGRTIRLLLPQGREAGRNASLALEPSAVQPAR